MSKPSEQRTINLLNLMAKLIYPTWYHDRQPFLVSLYYKQDKLFGVMGPLGLTIFQQDWWLKIARGSARLKEVQVHRANGVVVGSLTYIVRRNTLGIPSGGGPHLSRISGPIVSQNLSDEEKSRVLVQLIERLPNISFTFSISEHTPNARLIRQAFKYAGFECLDQINYSQPPGDVINRLGVKLREHIKQAHKKLDVINIDPDHFVSFYQANLKAAGNKKSYFPIEVARELITQGMKREPPQTRIIAASRKRLQRPSEQPAIDAAICIVWDNERCYYWLSTHHKEAYRDAIKLLIVTAMEHARKLGLIFDADCLNTPGSQKLFKTIFGMPNEEKRYIFTRSSRWSQLYEGHRSKIDKIKKFTIGSFQFIEFEKANSYN